jgi:hypothetical protein
LPSMHDWLLDPSQTDQKRSRNIFRSQRVRDQKLSERD